jgi:CHASE3 domain sensor protein
MEILSQLIGIISEYGIVILLLSIIVYFFYKKTEKLESELKDERTSCDFKLETLRTELRKSDRENIEILNKVTDVMEELNEGNTETLRYLKSIRTLIKNKLE